MNKKLIARAIILIVLIVGLSGCNEAPPKIIPISTLSTDPEQYLGQEVTVEGNCHDYSKKIFDESGNYFFYVSKTSLNGDYKITGTVMFFNDIYLINVSEAQPT